MYCEQSPSSCNPMRRNLLQHPRLRGLGIKIQIQPLAQLDLWYQQEDGHGRQATTSF